MLVLHRDLSDEAEQQTAGHAVARSLSEERRTGVETEDVEGTIAELRAARPDCIGIGNSMMFTRLGTTPEAMNALTGRKFFFIYKNGSDAPAWFLTMKNIVEASGVRPRTILLFVRDDELTRSYNGKQESSAYLNSLRSVHEPELESFMRQSRSGAGLDAGVNHWLAKWYSFPGWQEQASRRLMDLAMDMGGLGASKKNQRFVLSSRFDLSHLRGDLPSDVPVTDELTLMTSGTKASIESSLLPGMLRVAKQCGARLLVFRVKRRPDARTHLPKEPEEMSEYAVFLNIWQKGQGGLFFDETYDTTIQLADYLDGDHIRPERLDWYRRYFWKRMEGVLP